jgi:dihydrofolate synthase/folylpolyglutamate synthase
MNYSEALDWLGSLRRLGMKLGLDNMRALATELGHPEKALRFIHLAGTNGKGSTAAFTASILREAGYKVGLFTSPHLITLRERIQINELEISREAFAAACSKLATHAEQSGVVPTFFEALTALALDYFREQQVDWVVWETGLGGRLDSTNIVTPEVSVIPSIGRDHQEFLGDTLEKIALEKAGIVKPGVPVVCGVEQPEPRQVIRIIAKERGSAYVEPTELTRFLGLTPVLGLRGGFQRRNAGCAVAAVKVVFPDLAEEVIRRGLVQAEWPGRFQVLRESPPFVLDGAHNPEGARAVATAWREIFGSQRVHLVTGSVRGKDHVGLYAPLMEISERITLVPVKNERSILPDELKIHFSGKQVDLAEGLGSVWKALWEGQEPVLVVGSLFLVGEALALFQGVEAEFSLNERLVAATPTR